MSFVQVFDRVDKNKDGKISYDQFSQGFRDLYPLMSSEEMDKMFKEVDVDGDGQIDVMEFAKLS
ncbi:unnamed protein product [Eruca vesicaria subsp. sativa]|uniref:EF-hand domain-containing protein n=1 Tax=Eruca vesicaria subsp. sativa TaxID=29727 RepID=A0ABC8M350_ERUVS|nr:unnamed protein product [Eruca vesicaria subsp. sativa]